MIDLTVKQFAKLAGVKPAQASGFINVLEQLGAVTTVGKLRKQKEDGTYAIGKPSTVYRFTDDTWTILGDSLKLALTVEAPAEDTEATETVEMPLTDEDLADDLAVAAQ